MHAAAVFGDLREFSYPCNVCLRINAEMGECTRVFSIVRLEGSKFGRYSHFDVGVAFHKITPFAPQASLFPDKKSCELSTSREPVKLFA